MAVLVDEVLAPGECRAGFEGKGLPSGVYFCRIQGEGFSTDEEAGAVEMMLPEVFKMA
jgi:hypothetical protein